MSEYPYCPKNDRESIRQQKQSSNIASVIVTFVITSTFWVLLVGAMTVKQTYDYRREMIERGLAEYKTDKYGNIEFVMKTIQKVESKKK